MIMATIIKSTDSLTEPPLTTALTGRASPQGEAYFEGEKIFCGKFCKFPRKTLAILFRIWYSI